MNSGKHRNKAKSFSEIKIGDKAGFEVLIDEGKHALFSKVSGDFSPIHRNEKFSSKTAFGRRIGYAFHLSSFLSKLYGEYLPGGSSICLKQEDNFIKPFYIGDRLRIAGEVVGKIESTRLVEIESRIYKNKTELVFKGKGLVQVLFERNLSQPLYTVGNKYIFYPDLLRALRKAGIKKGDVVFVHSDVSAFGKLATFDRDFLLRSLVDSINECAGKNGTVIMPTFSYSFCKNEIFDVTETKSTVGVLTEFFRGKKGVCRTVHPIFSVAVSGKKKRFFLTRLSKDSFDGDSIFGKLHRKKAKIVFLGAPFQSCTFIHYIEQLFNVPYRFNKSFRGRIRIGKKLYSDKFDYFVQPMEKVVELDLSRLQRHLIKHKMMKKVRLGGGEILQVSADNMVTEGIKMLKNDIYSFLKREPGGIKND